jgi:hypothetical protein
MTRRVIVIPVDESMSDLGAQQVIAWAHADPVIGTMDSLVPSQRAAHQYAEHMANLGFCRCASCQAFRRCGANLLLTLQGEGKVLNGTQDPHNEAERRQSP